MTSLARTAAAPQPEASRAVWHPFTQHGLGEDIITVDHAEGAWLYTPDGRKILDAISSWWVITHGHGQPDIRAAIKAQADKLDQVIFAGFTHEPAETLAAELLKLAPKNLAHVFYTDSGSTAVEVALKMALGAHAHRGTERNRILAFEHAYHGDTFGAMAVGGRGVFSTPYEQYLFQVDRVPVPQLGNERAALETLATYLQVYGKNLAAFLFEPLLLGAGGMLTYQPTLLAKMAKLVRDTGAYLIADEVLTGWGRTGSLFAVEQADLQPDILCTGKGLTGGFLPLAATLASPEIFAAFHSDDPQKMFFHSSSYTANPLACAAGAANARLWQHPALMRHIKRIAFVHRAHLTSLVRKFPGLRTRQMGTVAAIDVQGQNGYFSDVGLPLRWHFLRRNILLRPLGNTIYILPPYCITDAELAFIYQEIELALSGKV